MFERNVQRRIEFRLMSLFCSALLLVLAGFPNFVKAEESNQTIDEPGPIYTTYDPPSGFHPSHEFEDAPAGLYTLDPSHAHLTFQMWHYGGTSRPQMRFRKIEGHYNWDPKHPEATKVTIEIAASSFESGDRDHEIRMAQPEVLNSAAPCCRTINFESTSIKFSGRTDDGRHKGVMMGNLTFLGKTLPITVPFTYNGFLGNRIGQRKMGFSATADFKRSSFGMTSEPSVGDDVHVEAEFEFMLPWVRPEHFPPR